MRSDYTYYDYLLVQMRDNVRNTIRITGPDVDNKIKLLLDFSEDESRHGSPLQIPVYEPFEDTYEDIVPRLPAFLTTVNHSECYETGPELALHNVDKACGSIDRMRLPAPAWPPN